MNLHASYSGSVDARRNELSRSPALQVFAVDKVAELVMLKSVDPSKAGESVLRMVNMKHIKVRKQPDVTACSQ